MNTKREHVPMTPLQRDQWLAERVKLLEPDSEIRAREYYERPPLPKERALTRKPMSDHDFVDDVDPPDYLVGLLRQHLKSPYERFELPVTTAQEIGFYATSDAIKRNTNDSRLNFPLNRTEVTAIPDLWTRYTSKKKG